MVEREDDEAVGGEEDFVLREGALDDVWGEVEVGGGEGGGEPGGAVPGLVSMCGTEGKGGRGDEPDAEFPRALFNGHGEDALVARAEGAEVDEAGAELVGVEAEAGDGAACFGGGHGRGDGDGGGGLRVVGGGHGPADVLAEEGVGRQSGGGGGGGGGG